MPIDPAPATPPQKPSARTGRPERPAPRRPAPARAWFLDAGNTLISIDWERVAGELEGLGLRAGPRTLARAEAAARPALSRRVAGRSTETLDTFELYVRLWLERLPGGPTTDLDQEALERTARALVPRLKVPGRADLLWNRALPGVAGALERLGARGIARVVVSNSDGSVERSLERAGLRGLVDHVVDSHLVGHEKPDPAIFEHARALVGVAPGDCLHVGDLLAVDVLGARAAGIEAVLLDPHGDWRAAEGDELRRLGCATARDLAALVDERLGGA